MTIDTNTLMIIGSSSLGEGEIDLGEKLMSAFLETLAKSDDLPSEIICINSGIFLTTGGSPVLDILERYEEQGASILSCGTCLDYYGRKERLCVGEATNMKETVNALLRFKKVLKP